MIRLKVSGPNFDDLAHRVELMAHPDLMPLAERIRPLMLADNRDGLLAGTDSFGDPMNDVEASTVKRGRGGDGPPLVPRYGASRAISDYRVRIEEGDGRTLLIGEWPNSPFIHFHATGTRHMVARDPIGIRPEGVALIAAEVYDFASSLVGGAS